jgi:hypothetical protein
MARFGVADPGADDGGESGPDSTFSATAPDTDDGSRSNKHDASHNACSS